MSEQPAATFYVRRGEFVDALRNVAAFSGSVNTKDPEAGLMTIHLGAGRVAISGHEGNTIAVATFLARDGAGDRLETDDVGEWRIDVDTAAVVRAVLTPPRDKDERAMWAGALARCRFEDGRLHVEEVDQMWPGRLVEVDLVADVFTESKPRTRSALKGITTVIQNSTTVSEEYEIPPKPLSALGRVAGGSSYELYIAFKGNCLVASIGGLVVVIAIGIAENRPVESLEMFPPGAPFDRHHDRILEVLEARARRMGAAS